MTALREPTGRSLHAVEALQVALRAERSALERLYRARQSFVTGTRIPAEVTVADVIDADLAEPKARLHEIEDKIDATPSGWLSCFSEYRWYNVLRQPLAFRAFVMQRRSRHLRLRDECRAAAAQLDSRARWLVSPAGRISITERLEECRVRRHRIIDEIGSAKAYLESARAELAALDVALERSAVFLKMLPSLEGRPDIIEALYFLPRRLDAKTLKAQQVLQVLTVMIKAITHSDDFRIFDTGTKVNGGTMPTAELLINSKSKPALLVAHADPIGVRLQSTNIEIELSEGPPLRMSVPETEMGLLAACVALDAVVLSGSGHVVKSVPIDVGG